MRSLTNTNMPNRILRDWTDSEAVESLQWEAEVFFTRLIMKVDDFGRFSANPKLLNSLLFPLREVKESDILSWLNQCDKARLLDVYEVDGKKFLQINKFGNTPRARASKFPAFASNLQANARNMKANACNVQANAPVTVTETVTETSTVSVTDHGEVEEEGEAMMMDEVPSDSLEINESDSKKTEYAFDGIQDIPIGRDWEQDFVEFWNEYPEHRKGNRYRAESEWSAVRLLLPTQAALLEALRAFKSSSEWKRENGKYIPAPHVWLSERRWQDAPAYSAPKKAPSTSKPIPLVDQSAADAWLEENYSFAEHPGRFHEWPQNLRNEFLTSKTIQVA